MSKKPLTEEQKEKNREHCRNYWLKNKDKIKAQKKKYRSENKEKIKAYELWYRLNKPEQNKSRYKKYRLKNKDRILKWRHKYLEKNRETLRLRTRRNVNELKGHYVVHAIHSTTKISVDTLRKHPDLVNAWREQIRIKRLLKSIKKGE